MARSRVLASRTRLVAVLGLGVASLLAPASALAQEGGDGADSGIRVRVGGGQPGGPRRGFRLAGDVAPAGMMRGDDPLTPSITSRELDQYGKALGLSAEQQELVRGLFDGYQEQFRAKAGEVSAKVEEARNQARESRDPGAWRGIGANIQDMVQARQTMEDQFFGDFKAMLTPEQMEKWPALERTRRREKSLNRGFVGGERMDVVQLVDRAKLADETRALLRDVLAGYEVDLDRELVARNKLFQENMSRFAELRGNMDGSRDELQKLYQQSREASIRVRDINRRYARQVEALLPEDRRAAWEAAVKEASFPQAYRSTWASRQITAAEGFADLDQAQKEGLAALRASYTRDLAAVNDRIAGAQEKYETSVTVDELMRRGRGGEVSDPTAEMQKQKDELDQRTSESLRKLLTPEQAGRLPERGVDPRAGRGPARVREFPRQNSPDAAELPAGGAGGR